MTTSRITSTRTIGRMDTSDLEDLHAVCVDSGQLTLAMDIEKELASRELEASLPAAQDEL